MPRPSSRMHSHTHTFECSHVNVYRSRSELPESFYCYQRYSWVFPFLPLHSDLGYWRQSFSLSYVYADACVDVETERHTHTQCRDIRADGKLIRENGNNGNVQAHEYNKRQRKKRFAIQHTNEQSSAPRIFEKKFRLVSLCSRAMAVV